MPRFWNQNRNPKAAAITASAAGPVSGTSKLEAVTATCERFAIVQRSGPTEILHCAATTGRAVVKRRAYPVHVHRRNFVA